MGSHWCFGDEAYFLIVFLSDLLVGVWSLLANCYLFEAFFQADLMESWSTTRPPLRAFFSILIILSLMIFMQFGSCKALPRL